VWLLFGNEKTAKNQVILGDVSKHASPNHSRASLDLIVEPRLYMLLRFQKAAVRKNYETGNQAFSIRLRFLTTRGDSLQKTIGNANYNALEATATARASSCNSLPTTRIASALIIRPLWEKRSWLRI